MYNPRVRRKSAEESNTASSIASFKNNPLSWWGCLFHGVTRRAILCGFCAPIMAIFTVQILGITFSNTWSHDPKSLVEVWQRLKMYHSVETNIIIGSSRYRAQIEVNLQFAPYYWVSFYCYRGGRAGFLRSSTVQFLLLYRWVGRHLCHVL